MAAKKRGSSKKVVTESETLALEPVIATAVAEATGLPVDPLVASFSTKITSERFSGLGGSPKPPSELKKEYTTVTRRMSTRTFAKRVARNKGSEYQRAVLLSAKALKGKWKAPSPEQAAEDAFNESGYPSGFKKDYLREFLKSASIIRDRSRVRVRGVKSGQYTEGSR